MIEDNNSHLSSLRRKRLDHERYIRNRAERLVQAKTYRDGHKEEIKAKRKEQIKRYILNYGRRNTQSVRLQ